MRLFEWGWRWLAQAIAQPILALLWVEHLQKCVLYLKFVHFHLHAGGVFFQHIASGLVVIEFGFGENMRDLVHACILRITSIIQGIVGGAFVRLADKAQLGFLNRRQIQLTHIAIGLSIIGISGGNGANQAQAYAANPALKIQLMKHAHLPHGYCYGASIQQTV